MYKDVMLKINRELFLNGKISREVYVSAEKIILKEADYDKTSRQA